MNPPPWMSSSAGRPPAGGVALRGVHAHEHVGGAVGTGRVVVGDDDPGRVDRGVERRDQLGEHRPGPFEVVGVKGRQELQDRHQLGIDRVGHAGRMTEVSNRPASHPSSAVSR